MLAGPVLSLSHQVVHGALALIRQPSHHDRAGNIRAVSVHSGSKVKQQPIPGLDRSVAGPRVRQRALRSRRDNGGERMPLAAADTEFPLEGSGHIDLALTHMDQLQGGLERLARQSGSLADGSNLRRIFAHSQSLHQVCRGLEEHAGLRPRELLRLLYGDDMRFEAYFSQPRTLLEHLPEA